MHVYGAGFFLSFCNLLLKTALFLCWTATHLYPFKFLYNWDQSSICLLFSSGWVHSTVLQPVAVFEACSAWTIQAYCSPSNLELYTWQDYCPVGLPPCLPQELEASGSSPANRIPKSSTNISPSWTSKKLNLGFVHWHNPNLSRPIQMQCPDCD